MDESRSHTDESICTLIGVLNYIAAALCIPLGAVYAHLLYGHSRKLALAYLVTACITAFFCWCWARIAFMVRRLSLEARGASTNPPTRKRQSPPGHPSGDADAFWSQRLGDE